MKEQVVLSLHDVNPPKPEFRRYYESRNGGIAQDIASYLELPYVGEVGVGELLDTAYFVPAKTLTESSSLKIDPLGTEDFYGAKVDSLDSVGKSILHPSVSPENTPDFHSARFSEGVRELVLPGVTGFTKEDLVSSYLELSKEQVLRLKLPGESDGNGQFEITDLDHLRRLLTSIDDTFIGEHGLILEPNLKDPHTISVGFMILGQDTFSFIAYQKNELVQEGDSQRNRYAGARVITVRGGLDKLFDIGGLDSESLAAIEASYKFNNAFLAEFNPLASRLSYDFLIGLDQESNRIGGVTDITPRLGGTCPGLMLSAEYFKNNITSQLIKSEVTLNYSPDVIAESEVGARRYIDTPSLRLTARLNDATIGMKI